MNNDKCVIPEIVSNCAFDDIVLRQYNIPQLSRRAINALGKIDIKCIKELLDSGLDFMNVRQIGEKTACEISEFISLVQNTDYGIYVNIELPSSKYSDQAISTVSLVQVPIRLFDNNVRLYNALTSKYGGDYKYIEIIDIDPEEIRNYPMCGKKAVDSLKKLQHDIPLEIDKLNKFAESLAIRELPILTEEEQGLDLCSRFCIAFNQLAQEFRTRTESKFAYYPQIIESMLEIADENVNDVRKRIGLSIGGKTGERVRQKIDELRLNIMQGSNCTFLDNVYLKDSFIDELEAFRDSLVYQPVEQYSNMASNKGWRFLLIMLNIDFNKDKDTYVHLFYDKDDQLAGPIKQLEIDTYNYVAKHIIPISFVQIFDELQATESAIRRYDLSDILKSYLENEPRIEKFIQDDEEVYQVKFEYLKDYQKDVRCIYNNRPNLTQRKYSKTTIYFKSYNCKPVGKLGWIYNPGSNNSKPSVIDFVKTYALSHANEVIKKEDFVKHVHQNGYSDYRADTLCSYLRNNGFVFSKDHKLCCNAEFASRHNPDIWVLERKNAANWILNQAIHILLIEKEASDYSMPLDELVSSIYNHDDCPSCRIYQIRSSILRYSNYDSITDSEVNAHSLFNCDISSQKYTIRLNISELRNGTFNLDTIGTAAKRQNYHDTVISTVVELLKNEPDHSRRLSEICQLCKPIFDAQNVSPNQFYKIIKQLPDEVTRYESDSNVFLKWNKEQVSYIPSFTTASGKPYIASSEEIDTDSAKISISSTKEELPLVEQTESDNRPTIEYSRRPDVDWNVIESNLKSELKYYSDNNWFGGISLTSAISKFRSIILKSVNVNISRTIPRIMYEFWNYKNDIYDQNNFLRDLVLNYEALLRTIYAINNNTSEPANTTGLFDCCQLIQGFDIDKQNGNSKFEQTFHKLKFFRNKVAHGGNWELSFIQRCQYITSFIALYVYTVNRYCKVNLP